MVLDLFLLDIALHLQNGNFGATHGRSYMKDKSTAVDQDTFALSKLLFDDTAEPYRPGADAGATLLARAQNYRMPDVIGRIAKGTEPLIDQEHMNVPLDALAPVTPDPPAPYGIAFDDPENIPFWWERGAQTAWQVVPTTIATLDQYALWESQFYAPFKPLADLVGDDMDLAQDLAQSLAPVLTFGLLTEVHTYTYRTADVMLSTAQDYRQGLFSEQTHTWQATLDEHAIVFTTHPKNEPQVGTQWPDEDGYWTGNGSMPRAAQHGAVSINVYAPQFEIFPPAARRFHLPRLHARVLPTGAVRRGGAGRRLDVRAQGRRVRRAVVAARGRDGVRTTRARSSPTGSRNRSTSSPTAVRTSGSRRWVTRRPSTPSTGSGRRWARPRSPRPTAPSRTSPRPRAR